MVAERERAHRERDRRAGEGAAEQDGERHGEAPPVDPRLGRRCASGAHELAARRVAIERRLRERLRDHRLERRGQLRRGLRQLRRRRVQVRVQDGELRRAMEGRRPREALVQHARERVDVGAAVDGAALDLLRRRVLGRPDEAARPRRPVGPELLRDAEVREERAVVVGDEDVRGLHVPVDERACVRRVERRAHLGSDPERGPERQAPLGREQRLQVDPVHARHGDVEQVALLAGVVDRDDARVVERGGELRLAQESLAEVGLAEGRREQLKGGRPPQPDVLGAVDDARRALAERLDDAIAPELGADAAVELHLYEL